MSQEDRDAGRAKQEKYQGLRGGADDPWRAIRSSIRKAIPKFRPTQPNLLVIADDRFVALAEWGKLAADHALFVQSTALDGEAGYFTTNQFENLGGVALFETQLFLSGGLQYTFLLYPNPTARIETALPPAFIKSFLK